MMAASRTYVDLSRQIDDLTAQLSESRRQMADLERRYWVLVQRQAGTNVVSLASGAVLDLQHVEIRRDGQTVRLSRSQAELLELLLTHGRQPVSTLALLQYGAVSSQTANALHQLVSRLRIKLKTIGADGDIVRTAAGYLLEVAR